MNHTPSPLACTGDHERRARVRASALNGLDAVEVDCAQTTLTVYFLGRAPENLTPAHWRIEGGRRVRDLRVLAQRIEFSDDEGLDDRVLLTLDRPGDFSTYRLCVQALAPDGRPSGAPPADFDPRYACVCFNFKTGCPSDLDCTATSACDEAPLAEPVIDYLAKDYASFRRLLLDRMALLMPEWTERHAPDIGITLTELLAYTGDQLSYHQDAVATEAYLDTARLRTSVRRHARLVDYLLHEGCNARVWLAFTTTKEALALQADTFYAITRHPQRPDALLVQFDLPALAPAPYLAFQPRLPAGQADLTLRSARNRITLYRWGEDGCCLPRGATRATLLDPGKLPEAPEDSGQDTGKDGECTPPPPEPVDIEAGIADGRWHRLKLQAGEVLLFEEVLGPRTGAPADADPSHRHAVRLTCTTPSWDPLTRQLLYEVEWCVEDALPFALCLSTTSEAPGCEPLEDVSVAWGNVVLFDHGLTVHDPLGEVPTASETAHCPTPCDAAEPARLPGPFKLALPRPDPTHAVPMDGCGGPPGCGGCGGFAAGAALLQDVTLALPDVVLHSQPADAAPGTPPRRWSARPDLLASGPDERHFVVEIDDDRVAWLRFGDGDTGCRPEAGERFEAGYRIGNGTAGNLGAEALVQLVFRDALPEDEGLRVRNPMPALGGSAPESAAEARLRAPVAFKRRLERAVNAADYAAIVMRDFPAQVQRAAAVMRATGACVEVQVAVDAAGRAEPDSALLDCIAAHLQRYRRIGHDVRVVAARAVPLDVALHICVKAGYLRAHVKAAVLAALGNGRLRGGHGAASALGFFHPDALLLGEPVSASRLIARAQAVEGVAGVVLQRFERLFEGPNDELENGLLPLAPLEVARLDNDPDAPENGRLTLELEGGR